MTSPFKKRLHREIKLRLQEMRDGCVDCLEKGTFCHKHRIEAAELVTEPRKHLNLNAKPPKGDPA